MDVRRAKERVVRAAMAYWQYAINRDDFDGNSEKIALLDRKLNDACADLAKARGEEVK